MPHGCHVCSIVPPYMLRKLADHAEHRHQALRTIEISERLRGARQNTLLMPLLGAPGVKHRRVYDARHLTTLPGAKVRNEGAAASADVAVNEAYDYYGDTYDFYRQVLSRNSVDDHASRSSRPCISTRATTTRSGTARKWSTATATARSSSASPPASTSSGTSSRTG